MLRAASRIHFKTILATSRGIALALAAIVIAASPCMAVPLATTLSDQTSKNHNLAGGLRGFNRFAFAVEASHWRLPLPPPDRAVYVARPQETVAIDVEKTLAAAEPASTVEVVEAPSTIRSRPQKSKLHKFKSPRRLGYRRYASKRTRARKPEPKPAYERNWKMRALFPDR